MAELSHKTADCNTGTIPKDQRECNDSCPTRLLTAIQALSLKTKRSAMLAVPLKTRGCVMLALPDVLDSP